LFTSVAVIVELLESSGVINSEKLERGKGIMQINIGFTCRECGEDQEFVIDTSNYGVLVAVDHGSPPAIAETGFWSWTKTELIELVCKDCAHVSGELGLGYRFREEHRHSWEREVLGLK